MATVVDAPSALGTYMLKGWVLTNQSCPTAGCRVPLLRSPAGQEPTVHLCVGCDANADGSRREPPPPSQAQDASSIPASDSSASRMTRASTPATEVSEASDDLPPFVESEETRRRREQTDRASAEIGRRLLQGWTMLGDECPRDDCYYVPLVRPPKTNAEPDPKKECVLCGSFYRTAKDWAGRESLVLDLPMPTPASDPANRISSNAPPASSSIRPSQQKMVPQQPIGPGPEQSSVVSMNPINLPASIMGALDASSEALQLSLQTLTARLTSLASNPPLADPASIASTADAISKVTQALSQVKQLQWSETQAHTMT